MPKLLTNIQRKPFEIQVWIVITAIAGLRTLKAVVQDLTGTSNATGLAVDVFILLTFVALFLLIYKEKIRHIPIVVGLILIILLTVSYVQFGGVGGTTEYNIMALGVLLVLAYKKKKLIWILIAYFIIILAATLDLHFNGWLTRNFFKGYSTSLDAYFTTLLALLILILYFKNALVSESKRIIELRTKLGRQIRTIRSQHKELEKQQQLLHEVNNRLEEEIKRHDLHIVNQDKAIQDYIWLSTESLHIPLQRIASSVHGLRENNFLESQLKGQVAELRLVIQSLKEELKQHESNRGKQ
jgi:glucan phosphoethanolaminetransferase (alkaline phosphatase superfamily)